jgi:hypothetical protein
MLIRIRIATIVTIDQESVRHDGHNIRPSHPPAGIH